MAKSIIVTRNVSGNTHDVGVWLNHWGYADNVVYIDRVTSLTSVVMIKLSPEEFKVFEEMKNAK